MLWSIKRSLTGSLLVLALFIVVGLGLRALLGLDDDLALPARWPVVFAVALGAVLLNDFGLHALLWWLWPQFYRPRYRALVTHFEGQGPLHFLTSGLLAAGEELLFRGALLYGLLEVAPPLVALLVSAVAFGVAHWARPRALHWFAVMAFWEGVVLGAVYLATGSIVFMMVLHFVHDAGGYAFFAAERQRGIWLAPAGSAADG